MGLSCMVRGFAPPPRLLAVRPLGEWTLVAAGMLSDGHPTGLLPQHLALAGSCTPQLGQPA